MVLKAVIRPEFRPSKVLADLPFSWKSPRLHPVSAPMPKCSPDCQCSPKCLIKATVLGLLAMVGLLALPFLNCFADASAMPEFAKFLGHFHPVVLHLPIGVYALILLQELVATVRREPSERGIGLIMGFGVVSSIVAVLAGYLLWRSGGDDYQNDLATRHLWGGTLFAVGTIIVALLKGWGSVKGWNVWSYRLPLLALIALMGFASHDGASMTHGSDFLTKHAPAPIKKLLGEGGGASSSKEPMFYDQVVQPILERRCVQCHKEGKAKGQLRMDTYEWLAKGGKGGAAFVAGEPHSSAILERVHLPLDDEEHMPPKGKPQLEEGEIKVIEWWIAQGAKNDVKLAETKMPADIESIVAALVKLPRETAGGATAGHKAPAGPDAQLKQLVSSLSTKFPGTLAFESQQSPAVVFSAVSLRSKLDHEQWSQFAPVLPHLVSADLTATGISNESVVLLEKAPQLRSLRLAQTGITDAALDSVLKLGQLESLNLYGTAITDAGLMKLAAMPNLKRLYLWQTKVTKEGVDGFRTKLPTCEIVAGE